MQVRYPVVSPSLDGVLSHESFMYEGIRRPTELLRVLDSPATGGRVVRLPHHEKVLEQYFYDLYGVFMKKLSSFVLESRYLPDENVRLLAMLQEMIKIKKLLS